MKPIQQMAGSTMKKGYFRLFICLAGALTQQTFAAESIVVSSGDIQFYGELVNAPCAVDLISEHQLVSMGQIKDDALVTPGEWANPTAFQIRLEDCDTTVRSTAGIVFAGAPDGNDPTVFTTGYGVDAAKHVGLGIFDAKGSQLVPNGMPVNWMALNDGQTVLHYTAKYRSTGNDVTPGDASASVDFSVFYQ
jgi:fimbrial protein